MWDVNRIIKSKLFINFYNSFFLYGFSHIIPLVLIPFLLNTIGVEKYGLINFALAFTFYFQVLYEFGFDLSNVRHVISNRDYSLELSKILSSILACKILIIICSLLIYLPIILFIESFKASLLLYIIAFVRLIGIAIAPYWLFRSMEDLKRITQITIPIKIICILPLFLIVKSPDTYLWVMFFFALQEVVSGIVSLYVAKKKYHLKFQKVAINDIKFFIKDSIPFFTSTFFMRIYKNSNPIFLGFFCGDYIVGIYSAAEKMHNAYSSFISPLLSHVLYPYFTRIKDNVIINKITLLIVIGNGLSLVLIFFLSPYFFPYYIKTDTLLILSYFDLFLLLLLISVPNDILGFPYLAVMGYVNKINTTAILTAIIYIIGAVALIISNLVSITSMIILLIGSTSICLLLRIYYIFFSKK